jgi:hypothetical protein
VDVKGAHRGVDGEELARPAADLEEDGDGSLDGRAHHSESGTAHRHEPAHLAKPLERDQPGLLRSDEREREEADPIPITRSRLEVAQFGMLAVTTT